MTSEGYWYRYGDRHKLQIPAEGRVQHDWRHFRTRVERGATAANTGFMFECDPNAPRNAEPQNTRPHLYILPLRVPVNRVNDVLAALDQRPYERIGYATPLYLRGGELAHEAVGHDTPGAVLFFPLKEPVPAKDADAALAALGLVGLVDATAVRGFFEHFSEADEDARKSMSQFSKPGDRALSLL